MSKISVLEIIGDSSLAGAPRHLLGILENLDLDKFDIHCICPPGALAGEIKDIHRHIDLELIPMRTRLDLEAIKKIRKNIKHLKLDIIHIHGTRAGSLGRLAAIGLNIPVIYTEHLWTDDYKMQNRFLNYLHHIAGWFLDLFTTLNIAVSGAVKDFMIKNNISYEEKIKVIYNGIEPTKAQAKIFTHGEDYLIGTVGTIIPLKGMQYLIQAMPKVLEEFPKARLEIIGEGSFKKYLQQEVKKLKLTKFVDFIGFEADVQKRLSKLDLYVQPSISESFGLAIVQAMSVGLPIVATKTGGIPEVVTENKSGILVKSANASALAEAIRKILQDPALAKRMGDFARREATVRFNLKDMMRELEKTYEEVAQNPAFSE